jgi:muramoyltetrapeptide carboxypeptidase
VLLLNKPKMIKHGDTIGLLAPASRTDLKNVEMAVERLKGLGYKVKVGKSPYESFGYLSGEDEVRAADINSMFRDEEISGIICTRGGYGTPRILPLLDYDAIRKNPKVFIGFSDITALHVAFNQKSDLVTFHGPMAVANLIKETSQFTLGSLFDAVGNVSSTRIIENPEGEIIETVFPGNCEGIITGGNLSLITSGIGTPYEIDTRGKILFIEEISEDIYKIDRALNQLKLAGKFDDAVGIILGDFNDCDRSKHDESLSLRDVINQHLIPSRKPTIFNLKSGHCEPMVTIPMGVKVGLDATKRTVTLLENSVE